MSKRFSSEKPIIVLYEDDHYVAFYKPAGLLAVPTDKGDERALSDMVNESFRLRQEPSPNAPQGGPLAKAKEDAMKLHPCHRIDKETSGVIVFAKGHASQEALMDLFREKKVQKKYIAFVHGRLRHSKDEIRIPLKEPKFARGARVAVRGRKDDDKEAITRYAVLEQKARYAVVEVIPLTGRTNQIRIHFKEIGHPLVGENKFIYRKDHALKFKRTALHAMELAFKSPMTGEEIQIFAPLSTDMKNFLERNRT